MLSSSLFSKQGVADSSIMTNVPTRDYFKTILQVLQKILPHPSCTLDIRYKYSITDQNSINSVNNFIHLFEIQVFYVLVG
jgi:hypothetical protein